MHLRVFCKFFIKKIKEFKGIFCQNKGIFRDWPKIKEFPSKGISINKMKTFSF